MINSSASNQFIVKNYLENTVLLIIDLFNDFLSEGGKLWSTTKETVKGVNLIKNLKIYSLQQDPWASRSYTFLIIKQKKETM
jgi:hypothetical protein